MQKKFSKEQMTSFQKRIFKIVKKIPKGKTLKYKEVARLAGSPRAWRAVGNILNKNKDPKIPCHRVIRSDGKIGGHNKGIQKKINLLKKEGVFTDRRKIALPPHLIGIGAPLKAGRKSYSK